MTYIKKQNQLFSFIIPDDSDVHVYTAFKEVFGSFDAFCT